MAALKAGDILDGKYQILKEIGEGGMGTVYRARQLTLGRDVAIKVPREGMRPDQLARFEREALTIASLGHDNIVHIYECQTRSDIHYIAMEFVEGVDLTRLFSNAPERFTVRDVAIIVRACWAGLGFIHLNGIIHRDIKPSNIMAMRLGDDSWQVKIMDFGLVRSWSSDPMDAQDTRLTQDGAVMGTPLFMPPEQLKGARVTKASDVFSMACVTFFAFTRRNAYTGKLFDRMDPANQKQPPSMRAHVPSLPEALDRLVQECLVSDPMIRPVDSARIGEQIYRIMLPYFDEPMEPVWMGERSLPTGEAGAAGKPARQPVPTKDSEATTVMEEQTPATDPPSAAPARRSGRGLLVAALVLAFLATSTAVLWPVLTGQVASGVEPGPGVIASTPGVSPGQAESGAPSGTEPGTGAPPAREAEPPEADTATPAEAAAARDELAALGKKVELEVQALMADSARRRSWVSERILERASKLSSELDRTLTTGDRLTQRDQHGQARDLFAAALARAQAEAAFLMQGVELDEARGHAEAARETFSSAMQSAANGATPSADAARAPELLRAGDDAFDAANVGAALESYGAAAAGWSAATAELNRFAEARRALNAQWSEPDLEPGHACWAGTREAMDRAQATLAEGDWAGAIAAAEAARAGAARVAAEYREARALEASVQELLGGTLAGFVDGRREVAEIDALLRRIDRGSRLMEAGDLAASIAAWKEIATP